MDTVNVVIRNDGTRIETQRSSSNGMVRTKTITTKQCGCEVTVSWSNGGAQYGSYGHTSKTCSCHTIRSWNAA